eukprot:6414446-Amphidinium_carterae.1
MGFTSMRNADESWLRSGISKRASHCQMHASRSMLAEQVLPHARWAPIRRTIEMDTMSWPNYLLSVPEGASDVNDIDNTAKSCKVATSYLYPCL